MTRIGTQLKTVGKLSWRNLWRNYRRTGIMLGAIAVGVWAMIFMTALMRGMVDDMLLQGIRNLPGHVQIQHPEFLDDPNVVNSIDQPRGDLLEALNQSGAEAWASRIRVPAVIASERDSRGVNLVGIEPSSEAAITGLPQQLVEGRFLESSNDKGLVVGARLAERLETRLGKRVVVMSQDPDNNIRERGFRIVGIYRAELAALEEANIYAARGTLQQLLRIDGRVSQIVLVGEHHRDIESLYRKIQAAAPPGVEIKPWYEIDSYLRVMFEMMDGFVLVWVIIIFLALSFGLVNTLVMAVFERVREIGLMMALGMKPGMILGQIVIESLLLLAVGLAIGDALAWVSVKAIEDGVDISAVAEGMEMMGAASVLYPKLFLKDVVLANVVVLILGFFASLSPAWRASRYEPVEAITKV